MSNVAKRRRGGIPFGTPFPGAGRPQSLMQQRRYSTEIPPTVGPIAYRDSSFVANGTSSASHTIVIPATTVVGDGMVLIVVSGAGVSENLTTPSGWTLVASRQKATNISSSVYTRVAQSGDAGSNVTLTGDATARRAGIILVYSGIGDPIILDEENSEETGTVTAHVTPSLTINNINAWEIQAVADRSSPGSTTITPPDSLSLRATAANTGSGAPTLAAADSNRPPTSSSYGDDTWNGTVATPNAIMWTIALNPFEATVPDEGWGMRIF